MIYLLAQLYSYMRFAAFLIFFYIFWQEIVGSASFADSSQQKHVKLDNFLPVPPVSSYCVSFCQNGNCYIWILVMLSRMVHYFVSWLIHAWIWSHAGLKVWKILAVWIWILMYVSSNSIIWYLCLKYLFLQECFFPEP